MHKPLLILKLGTSSVIDDAGAMNVGLLESVAEQCRQLTGRYRLMIVSSGAVGLGRPFLQKFNGKLKERKAAAAVGNPLLMHHYSAAFGRHGLHLAQTLCERSHFSNRENFLQLRQTIETLWSNGIIPVANENDVVSDLELKFSDNDELATLIAVGFGAAVLLFGTSVDGVMDGNGKVVPVIDEFTEEVMALATGEKSVFGLGGMISKLTFARLATRLGIRVVIFGSSGENKILEALEGKTGTMCRPHASSPDARKKWLASGSIVSGRITVDAGAGAALANRKSLLSVGVRSIDMSFEKGEVIEIYVEGSNWPLCVARTKLSSSDLADKIGAANVKVAHADDIVLL
jgi:glutamate 5-kinase